jgi:FkbM family methyltransferase
MKWISGSGPHSNWLGINEISKRKQFASMVRPGQTVYDLGANVGSYTLLAAKLVGPAGRVVAIEPLPANLAYLRRHVEINLLANVRIVSAAVTDRVGTLRFRATPDRVTSHIADDGDVVVDCTTVDALVTDGMAPPDCLKIDVEGAEAAVLRGATRTLAGIRPIIFLATHGEQAREESHALLDAAGYDIAPIPDLDSEFIAQPRAPGHTERRSAQ